MVDILRRSVHKRWFSCLPLPAPVAAAAAADLVQLFGPPIASATLLLFILVLVSMHGSVQAGVAVKVDQ